MAKKKRRKVPKKPRVEAPTFKGTWLWKALLIAAVAVPIISTLFFWYQTGFERPMPKEVFDRVAENPIIFPAFVGLVAVSFWVQYRSFPLERRKRETMRKVPILLFMGVGVAVITAVFLWWQDPEVSTRSIISFIVHRPFIIGSAGGLVLGGLALIFLLLSKEEQRRSIKVALTLIAAFLVFGGPTYLLFFLRTLNLPYLLLVLVGLFSFVMGIILFTKLIEEKET